MHTEPSQLTKKVEQDKTGNLPQNGKGSFVGNVSKLMGATAFGQVLGVISLPIITRLFSPDAFGLLGVYMAITGILGVIVCMRYELTIVLPKEDNDAANLFWVSILFTVFWTVFSGLIILLFRDTLVTLMNAPEIAPFLWLVPIGIFFGGVLTTLGHWNTRRAQFGRLAGVNMIGSVVTTGSKLGAGFGGFVSGGALILASLAGTVTGSYILGRKILREEGKYIFSNFSVPKMKTLMKKYSNISIFNSASSLFNSISQKAPLILLAYFFSPVIVGYYLLGHKLLKIPVNLIGNSVRKVYFQRASNEWNKTGSLADLTLNTATILSIISLFSMTLFISIIAPLTPVIFGGEWNVAGKYMQWIVLGVGLSFVCTPISSLTTILLKENIDLYIQIFSFFLRTLALLVGGILIADPFITVILYSIASLIYYLIYLIWIFIASRASISAFLRDIKYMLLISFFTVISSITLHYYNISYIYISIIIVIYLIIYLFAVSRYMKNIGITKINPN